MELSSIVGNQRIAEIFSIVVNLLSS